MFSIRRAVLGAVATGLLTLCGPAAANARIVTVARHSFQQDNESVLAVYGDRYALVGTSFSSNALYVYDLARRRQAARWTMPALVPAGQSAFPYTMNGLAIDQPRGLLYIANGMRGDVVRVDLTGRTAPLSFGVGLENPQQLALSDDGRYLYVDNSASTGVYEAATGTQLATLPFGTAIAAGHGRLYTLRVGHGFATVAGYDERGGHGRRLATFHGPALSAPSGDVAISPDGRRLYVLWAGLHVLDADTGRVLSTMRLPLFPQYTGLAVAPNGRQAMLTSTDAVGWSETPTDNPQYIAVHYGFVSGGVVPVDLVRMRPIVAHLGSITTPRMGAYTADSRLFVVSESGRIDVISTGTSGRDRYRTPRLDLANPGGGGSGGSGSGSGGSGSGGSTGSGGSGGAGGSGGTGGSTSTPGCTAQNLSGTWGYNDSGFYTPTAVLQQSGSQLSGTLTDPDGSSYSIAGSVSGSSVTMTFTPASGDSSTTYAGSFNGTVTPFPGYTSPMIDGTGTYNGSSNSSASFGNCQP